MNIESIRSFMAVVKYKSISKAASRAFLTQPALSQRLKKLEEGLGFPLFYRDWNGTHLTEQGNYFLPHAVQLLHEIDSTSHVLHDKQGGVPRSFKEAKKVDGKAVIGIDIWLSSFFTESLVENVLKVMEGAGFKIITKPAPPSSTDRSVNH